MTLGIEIILNLWQLSHIFSHIHFGFCCFFFLSEEKLVRIFLGIVYVKPCTKVYGKIDSLEKVIVDT